LITIAQAGRLKLSTAVRPLSEVNEAIAELAAGSTSSRTVLAP
jgi:D-arabinose 1-dehydrogenase-like Zn-dependent alcohol dehydrogenase